MVRSFGKKLWREESGAVASVYALALPALIAIGGIAFDYARLAAMDTELQNAADMAALAAATQLDGKTGQCDRAIAAAKNLLKSADNTGNDSGNLTLFANDGAGVDVTIGTQPAGCSTVAANPIRFYTTADGNTLATNESQAKFVEVTVAARTARYALTPIVGALHSGAVNGTARAGMGQAICKVPPVMMCNPNEPSSLTFDPDAMRGRGLKLKATGGDGQWSPGNFGFLDVGTGANDLGKLIGYGSPPGDCVQVENPSTQPGAISSVINDFNTRFDIYEGGDNINCFSNSLCPPSRNSRKDVVIDAPSGGASSGGMASLLPTRTNISVWRKFFEGLSPIQPAYAQGKSGSNGGGSNGGGSNGGGSGGGSTSGGSTSGGSTSGGSTSGGTSSGGSNGGGSSGGLTKNECGFATGVGSKGWRISNNPYRPLSAVTYATEILNGVRSSYPDAMGYPRDICHAWDDEASCPIVDGIGGRIGDGVWDLDAYWRVNHGSAYGNEVGSDPTRYDVYLWEMGDPTNRLTTRSVTGGFEDHGTPICRPTGVVPNDTTPDRRVLPVAVVNCVSEGINGSEAVTPITWVDVFLVEPSITRNGYTDSGDIYVEIIGRTSSGTGGTSGQAVLRRTPYLVR